jgi:hypothetical protein
MNAEARLNSLVGFAVQILNQKESANLNELKALLDDAGLDSSDIRFRVANHVWERRSYLINGDDTKYARCKDEIQLMLHNEVSGNKEHSSFDDKPSGIYISFGNKNYVIQFRSKR